MTSFLQLEQVAGTLALELVPDWLEPAEMGLTRAIKH